ncbi:jg10448 [Pararge aegeria aegeria]|uniref:Jg10448 protein n=1 Tax=Pararge aegeria aegeria TaxID=348720 RepID=A0A8S4REB4_9NEOP|nr:jg10448 [Pararge aegeria aegeria]
MFKISWRQFISNAQVLRRAQCQGKLMITFRGSLFEFPRLILEGKITGKPPGRPRKKWFDDIREWTYLFGIEEDGTSSIFHRLTSELQYEDGT